MDILGFVNCQDHAVMQDKVCPQTNSISISWELRNTNFWNPNPDLRNQWVGFTETPSCF